MNGLVREVFSVIGSVQLQADHPELFHYTGRPAFEKIVETNTLWATHYKNLNDDEEIMVLKGPLMELMTGLFEEHIRRRPRHLRRMFKATTNGPKIARDFVNAVYHATFENKTSFTAIEAFTTSFTTHSRDTVEIQENGLQSQWEDYAGADGFCIVIDTPQMCHLLRLECEARYWTHLNIEPVRYLVDGVPLADHFPELMTAAASSIEQFLNHVRYPEMAVPEFLIGATLLKKPKWQREREVRIAAVPGTQAFLDQGKRQRLDMPQLPLPEVEPHPDGSGKLHVTVFKGLGVTLPIKRVIIGPSTRQSENADLAHKLVGADRVVLSNVLKR